MLTKKYLKSIILCIIFPKDPENIIGVEILEELRAINPSDVFMYVDIPEEK